MSLFTSAFLGQVQHPINILQEYLAAFGNKCQAAILSWLDNWTKTKRKEQQSDWVWLVLSDLAAELGYCKDTIFRHLHHLVEMGCLKDEGQGVGLLTGLGSTVLFPLNWLSILA